MTVVSTLIPEVYPGCKSGNDAYGLFCSLPFSLSTVNAVEGGYLVSDDRKIYCLTAIKGTKLNNAMPTKFQQENCFAMEEVLKCQDTIVDVQVTEHYVCILHRNTIEYYDNEKNKFMLENLPQHKAFRMFNCKGNKCITVGDDKRVVVWDLPSQKPVTQVLTSSLVKQTGLHNNDLYVLHHDGTLKMFRDAKCVEMINDVRHFGINDGLITVDAYGKCQGTFLANVVEDMEFFNTDTSITGVSSTHITHYNYRKSKSIAISLGGAELLSGCVRGSTVALIKGRKLVLLRL